MFCFPFVLGDGDFLVALLVDATRLEFGIFGLTFSRLWLLRCLVNIFANCTTKWIRISAEAFHMAVCIRKSLQQQQHGDFMQERRVQFGNMPTPSLREEREISSAFTQATQKLKCYQTA